MLLAVLCAGAAALLPHAPCLPARQVAGAPSSLSVATPPRRRHIRPVLAQSALVPSELPDLPDEKLIVAIERLGGRVTASDVAAAAGLDLLETRRQLLVLAQLSGAALEVSDGGELVFVVGDDVRGRLRRASWRMRGREAWSAAAPPLAWLARASFGVALLTSLAICTTAIAALSQSSSRDSSSSSSSAGSIPLSALGPRPFDFLVYRAYDPYYAYGYGSEMGLLQSCFSFLFGDGDPNADLPRRQARAIAELVRSQGGAATAEQLAPLMTPPLPPDDAAELEAGEGWVLDALVRYGGEPVVTDDGDIVYSFPELMVTARGDAALPAGRSRGGALAQGGAAAAVSSALTWDEQPRGWRPKVGERVVVATLPPNAPQRRRARLAPVAGAAGVVISDGRDQLPFQVRLGAPMRSARQPRDISLESPGDHAPSRLAGAV